MRKHTDPGVAQPAPGSVCPDDEITKPDNSAGVEISRLMRLIDQMPTVERRRFVALTGHYVNCPLGRRVLLEEIARELGRKE